jgi:hypothetical protein
MVRMDIAVKLIPELLVGRGGGWKIQNYEQMLKFYTMEPLCMKVFHMWRESWGSQSG